MKNVMTPEKVFALLLFMFLALWVGAEALKWAVRFIERRRWQRLLHVPRKPQGVFHDTH